jgi:penicillin-binding protein 1C
VLAAATVGADDDPWFDGTAARRQPGSTLKPLVVALALEQLATDDLVVRDAPIAFEGEDDVFEPRNYDGRFHGDVPVEDVLARSLNVPALRVAARLGPPRLLAFLRAAGFASLEESPAYYGVNLALGDGEVTLAELGAAYAALADDGRYRPLRWDHDAPQAAPRRVVDADVARIVARMLDDDARRAPTFDRDGVFAAPYPLAVKTGTSREHRDAWAIGFTPRLVAAVWMGRADGGATREVNGARGPGPALRAIVDASDPPRGAFPAPSSERWTEVRACIGAGDARSTRCERERLVFRRRAGARDAHAYTGSVEQEAQRDRPPRFVFPADGARLLRDPGRPDEALGLRVLVEGPPASAELVVRDGARTFAVRPGTPLALPLTAGVHRLVLEEAGRAVDARVVRVANAP